MIPAAFVQLKGFPLTTSGKIDRKSLPPPARTSQTGKNSMAPRSEAERLVSRIWQDILKVDEIGVDENFFDLGGHSLMLIKVLARLQKEYEKKLSIVDLFQHPTVSEQAALFVQEQTTKADTARWHSRTAKQKQALANRARIRFRRR